MARALTARLVGVAAPELAAAASAALPRLDAVGAVTAFAPTGGTSNSKFIDPQMQRLPPKEITHKKRVSRMWPAE